MPMNGFVRRAVFDFGYNLEDSLRYVKVNRVDVLGKSWDEVDEMNFTREIKDAIEKREAKKRES